MENTIQEAIQESLVKSRKACTAIGIAVLLIAALAALLCIMVSCAIAMNTAAKGSESVAVLIYIVVRGGVIVMALCVASMLFRDAGYGLTPFGPKQVMRLKLIAILLLALVVVETLFSIDYLAELDVFGVQLEIAITTMPLLNIPALVLAAVAFCMSVIFRYGALLQEEEDALV